MTSKIKRALSFRLQLHQKLYTIVRAYGDNSSAAARAIGVSYRNFCRWRSYTSVPRLEQFKKLDEVYLQACEMIETPGLLAARQKTSKKIKSIAAKLNLSHDTVRLLQAEGLY